jgi:hypothetical protein
MWKCNGNRCPGVGATCRLGFGLGAAGCVAGAACVLGGAAGCVVVDGGWVGGVVDGAGAVLEIGFALVLALGCAGRDGGVGRCGAGRLVGAAGLFGAGGIGGCAGRGVWPT